jgi:hypothetical protein
MITIRVEVTAEDINRGEPESCKHCPIALAIDRALSAAGIESRSWVMGRTVSFGKDTRRPRPWACLPYEALVFVVRFDEGHDLMPIVFDLELPDDLSPAAGPAIEEV